MVIEYNRLLFAASSSSGI